MELTTRAARELDAGCLADHIRRDLPVRRAPGIEPHLFEVVAPKLDAIVPSATTTHNVSVTSLGIKARCELLVYLLTAVLEEGSESGDAGVGGHAGALDGPAAEGDAVGWGERTIGRDAAVGVRGGWPGSRAC